MDIYLITLSGQVQSMLTSGGGNIGPWFSPDGQWLSFTSHRDGDDEIYIMRSDGTNVTQITNNNYNDYMSKWGP
jgi:Tol biopolymer transport system component